MGNLDAPSGLHWSDVSVAPPPSCVVSSLFKLFKLFSPLLILSARQPSRATMVHRLGCLGRSTRGFFSRLVVLVICLTSCRRLCTGLPHFFFGAGALCIFLGEYIFCSCFYIFDMVYAVIVFSTSDHVRLANL